jgi:hypothetical protein
MTTGNTTLLGLALPVEGELDGTWGDVVNNSITSLLDTAVAGTTTLSTDADVTLTDTNLAANQARQAVILWTASNGATTRNITAPARSKAYIVINAGTGSVVLRGAGPTTGVTVVTGEKCLAAWNGTDFVKIATTALVNLTSGVTGILPVANGGTATATPALVAGSGVTISGTWPNQTINATGTGGTVTAVSVVSANGLAGTSSGGATPALTLSTSITGVLKGNGTAISAAVAGTDYVTPTGTETLTNKTVTNLVFDGSYTEEVFALGTSGSLALNPANGTVQTCALTGDPTFTDSIGSGQSIVLRLTNGASYTVTWPTTTWVTAGGNTAPVLTAADTLVFWDIGGTLYGAYVGSFV